MFHTTEGAAAPTPELTSNLYDVRNRLNSFCDVLRHLNRRLERKNEQLMSLPLSAPTAASGGNLKDFASAQRPLLAEVNEAVMSLDSILDILSSTISVTETI